MHVTHISNSYLEFPRYPILKATCSIYQYRQPLYKQLKCISLSFHTYEKAVWEIHSTLILQCTQFLPPQSFLIEPHNSWLSQQVRKGQEGTGKPHSKCFILIPGRCIYHFNLHSLCNKIVSWPWLTTKDGKPLVFSKVYVNGYWKNDIKYWMAMNIKNQSKTIVIYVRVNYFVHHVCFTHLPACKIYTSPSWDKLETACNISSLKVQYLWVTINGTILGEKVVCTYKTEICFHSLGNSNS